MPRSRHFNAQLETVTSGGTANVEFSVPHTLEVVPTGWMVCRRNANASLYDSGTAWTTTTAYFKSSAVNASFLVLMFE